MPRILLKTVAQPVPLIYRGTGEVVQCPSYHLEIRLHIVPFHQRNFQKRPRTLAKSRNFDAILDTGASISQLPSAIWKPFRDEIRFLELAAPGSTVSVAGSTYTYQLGRILLAAHDLEGNWLPPQWTLVYLLNDDNDPSAALLGLTSPQLMNQSRLIHASSPSTNTTRELPIWSLEA